MTVSCEGLIIACELAAVRDIKETAVLAATL